ncbi:MAG: HAMP domain-containing histidine kinase [Gammaproteobacteria bacterium]|nr:HAMP domain-containing histidine kinase [Gammaproteobacteria bacterium]
MVDHNEVQTMIAVKPKLSYQTYRTLLTVVSFCLVAAVVAWTAMLRYQDFVNYHRAIAAGSVGELAHVIESTITERHRLVALFVEDHLDLIRATANNPDEESFQTQLSSRIKRLFPNYFTFTLADKNGNPLTQDFDGYVGDLCLDDVRTYAQSGINKVRVHPNASVYHYDVMAKWGDNNDVLLVSFPAADMSALLRASEAPGHQLMIIFPGENNLLEITSKGARDSTPMEDYRLPSDVQTRMLFSADIPRSRWVLSDYIEYEFLDNHRREMVIQSASLILLFGIFCLAIWVVLHRTNVSRAQAERVRDEFVSVVSHELRTPLTSIQGSLSLMAGGVCGEVSDEGRKLLTIALNNSDRLRILVDDLLDIRKIEAGRLELELQRIDVMDLVRKCVEQNQGYALRFDVRFAIRETTEGVEIVADAFRINQVMGNLLSNAAKFSPPGEVVDILVRKVAGDQIEIAIRDNGPGIDPQFRSQLFHKFTQLDGGNTRQVSGTGLGLAIAKALVEAHGGRVDFVSDPGRGSTFFFHLPVAKVRAV